jgi:hypothetical protein
MLREWLRLRAKVIWHNISAASPGKGFRAHLVVVAAVVHVATVRRRMPLKRRDVLLMLALLAVAAQSRITIIKVWWFRGP